MATYYDKLLLVLESQPPDKLLNVSDITKEMNVPSYKGVYIISAIKKGLHLNTVQKHTNQNTKTKYQYHWYSRKYPEENSSSSELSSE